MALQNINNKQATTTLDGGINDSVTALTAIDDATTAGFPAAPFPVLIDTELVNVTSTGTGKNWTIERGYGGTTAATHSSGADAYFKVTAEWFNDIAAGGLSDVLVALPSPNEILRYGQTGGVDLPYQGAVGNDGIVDYLGGISAHGATLTASQISTRSGRVAERALSPSTEWTADTAWTEYETAPWWMVECTDSDAAIKLTAIAFANGGHGECSTSGLIEARVKATATWETIGTIASSPSAGAWTTKYDVSSLVVDAVRLTQTGYWLTIGSMEMWGIWIADDTAYGEGWSNVAHGWGAWIAVASFSNSWVNFGSGAQDAEYRKHSDGRVELRGLIKTGTVTSSAFTLPTGYRPTAPVHVAVESNGAYGKVTVGTDGTVTPAVGSNTSLSLDTVRFDSTGGS